MPKRYEVEVETKEERKLSSMKVNRSKRETWFDLEKISSLQESELNVVRKRSLENINRWSLLKNKVINTGVGRENKEIEKLKSSLLKDITLFLYKEVGSVTEKNRDQSNSNNNIKIGSNKNTTLTNVVKEKDREGRDVKETVDRTKEVNIKKKKPRDPLKEASNFNIKKKDALGKSYYLTSMFIDSRTLLLISVILKVRDENILKTGLGGDYLVNNYFMRVKDIGKKRKILKRESDPESAEWNELKVR